MFDSSKLAMGKKSKNRNHNVNQCQKSNINIEQLSSFMKYDSSFFSPWTQISSCSPKDCPKYAMEMKFEAGSFFAFDVSAKYLFLYLFLA